MKKLLLHCFTIICCAQIHAQIITTIAGKGILGYTGDGGLATNALLDDLYYSYPAFDSDGNLYFGSSFYHTIRKIDKSGIITTIAGTIGVQGYSGDNGSALGAKLSKPTSIAIDRNNNIYFADQVSSIIRKIDANGIITTVSAAQYTPCENLNGKPLSAARFGAISGLTFDTNDNLYIADYGCHVVYKVNTAGMVSLVAGNFTEGYSGDGGPATAAQLAYPCKPGIDLVGNVYIADAQNHRIRKVTPAGMITTIAGTGTMGFSGDGGPATAAKLSFPGSVVFDKVGNLYFGENDSRIRKVDPSGIITTFAGVGVRGYSGDGGPAILAELTITQGRISIDANDDIYFCDERYSVIRKISNCLSSSYRKQPVNDTLCQTGVATFSVDVFNQSSLQWQENRGQGWVNISDNATYAGTTGANLSITADVSFNNFQYRCIANNTCGDVYSQPVKLIVTNPSSPQITISSNANNVCAGTSVTFTATATNGGTNPIYQWKKNGNNIGANTPTFTDNTFANNDVITCTLTSNVNCLSTVTAVSNNITLSITPLVTASITISSNVNNVCAGTSITFNATATNGGTSPVYQWKKNGSNVGTNNNTYTANNFVNGDIITCSLTSNDNCLATPTAASNSITTSIIPLVTPIITINSTANNVCPGTTITFNASATNGGTAPVYQWKKNGSNVGTNSNTYTANNFNNGDVITCALTSNANCLATTTAASNNIVINVFTPSVVNLDKSPQLCTGSTKQLDAGNFTSYLWNDSSTTRSLTIAQPGTYHVTVTDNNGCIASDTTHITTMLALPSNFLSADTSICTYDKLTLTADAGYRSYLWNNNAVTKDIIVTKPGLYSLTVTDQNKCVGSDSILVSPKECLTGIYVPNAFTPNNDHLNDVIYPIIGGNVIQYQFRIFNRWGKMVFASKELGRGWDGTLGGYPQDPGTFTWQCIYQLEGDKPRTAKGYIILLR